MYLRDASCTCGGNGSSWKEGDLDWRRYLAVSEAEYEKGKSSHVSGKCTQAASTELICQEMTDGTVLPRDQWKQAKISDPAYYLWVFGQGTKASMVNIKVLRKELLMCQAAHSTLVYCRYHCTKNIPTMLLFKSLLGGATVTLCCSIFKKKIMTLFY